MKITIVFGAFFPVPPIRGGAVEKAWFGLGQEFALRGHEIIMISRAIPQFHRKETLDSIQHRRLRGFDPPRSLTWLKVLDLVYSIRAWARVSRSDIIVTNTFWLPILLRNSRRGKVYVHVARYPKGQMRFYSGVTRLQAPSNAVAHAIEAEAPRLKDKLRVIPYPCPRAKGLPPAISERDKVILFVGRIHPEKGVHLLVEAFAGLTAQISSAWTLSIVGPAEEDLGGGGQSYLADLKRFAALAQGQVFFHGPVFDLESLEKHFYAARLFVYPSLAERGESFGLAPLEAMAHGCSVMVSSLECFTDFISDAETGLVFDHRSHDPSIALRKKLGSIMADQTLLERVAENGYRKSADYSTDRVADQFLHDFSSLLSQTDAAGTSR
jgi:glycosyltransferase involved in cell wall biosynthesis